MHKILKSSATLLAIIVIAGCEEHRKHNQDAPAANPHPPKTEKGTMPPADPPAVPPATGSQGTVGTGTR